LIFLLVKWKRENESNLFFGSAFKLDSPVDRLKHISQECLSIIKVEVKVPKIIRIVITIAEFQIYYTVI
jgi:hypothetical protein